MTAPKLEYKTKCKLPGCTKEFISDPFDIPVIGRPNERVIRFTTALMNHLEKQHPEVMGRISGAIQEYMGFLIVSLFEVQDPQLLQLREFIRSTVAEVSRRYKISDADIQDRVARLELDPDKEEGLNILLRDMRDLLTEEGKYARQTPAPPSILTL